MKSRSKIVCHPCEDKDPFPKIQNPKSEILNKSKILNPNEKGRMDSRLRGNDNQPKPESCNRAQYFSPVPMKWAPGKPCRERGSVLEGAASLSALGAFLMIMIQLVRLFSLDQMLLNEAQVRAESAIFKWQQENPRAVWSCLDMMEACYQAEGKSKILRNDVGISKEVCVVATNICNPE